MLNEDERLQQIINWVDEDPLRKKALECVSHLNLAQCYIAAGFVRNLVWDKLHQRAEPTALNDVDVIYFDLDEANELAYQIYEVQLNEQMPALNWQVRNQANMHKRNGDDPYSNSLDAMRYWPEKETAVAMRLSVNGDYECIAAFGFKTLFDLALSYNPKGNREAFEHRVHHKKWLQHWTSLRLKR